MTTRTMDEMRGAGLLEDGLTPKGRDWWRRLQGLTAAGLGSPRHADQIESFDAYRMDDLTNATVEPIDAEDFVSSTSGLLR